MPQYPNREQAERSGQRSAHYYTITGTPARGYTLTRIYPNTSLTERIDNPCSSGRYTYLGMFATRERATEELERITK